MRKDLPLYTLRGESPLAALAAAGHIAAALQQLEIELLIKPVIAP
jgi:hypothetical protein